MPAGRTAPLLLSLLLWGCSNHARSQAADAAPGVASCPPAGLAYLKAQLRGALNADIEWQAAQMSCEGGPRPDGSGLRLSIAGPLQGAGTTARRLRFVFGINAAGDVTEIREAPTNLTAILEGEQVFATRGDDKCTTDQLRRTPGDVTTRYDVRGFCTGPAGAADGASRLLVTTFEFSIGLHSKDPP